MNLVSWAIRHGVSPAALAELQLAMFPAPATADDGRSEAAAQQAVRFEAAMKGGRLFRNNVGVVTEETSLGLRFGLCNESAQVNSHYKSSDLIGIMPMRITPMHVGHTVGVFTAREIKKPGWAYAGSGREPAQLAFMEAVWKLGGNAAFATGAGTL